MNDNFNAPENELDENIVSGVEKAPKKKKGLKIAAVGVGAVAVVAGGGIIAYNTSDYVKNQVKLATLSPVEYHAWVAEKNSEELADSAYETYEKALEKIEKGISSDMYLKYKASDKVKNTLAALLVGSDADAFENSDGGRQLLDVIDNIDTISVGVNVKSRQDSMLETVYAALNDENLISMNLGMNQDLTYFFRMPELSEKWLGVDFKDFADSEFDYEMLTNSSQFFAKLSPKDVSSLITRYSAAFYNSIDNVKLEKDQKVKVGEIEMEYTVLTSELGEEDAYNIAGNFIKTLSEDELIKELIVDSYQLCDEDEYSKTLGDLLEELQKMKDEGDFDDDIINLITYVDAKGTIRGFEIQEPDDEFNIRLIVGADGNKSAAEFSCNDLDEEIISVVFNAEKSGDKYNGEIECEISGEDEDVSFAVEFSDIEFSGEDDEYISGDAVISVPGGITVPLTLSVDGKSQIISYDINIDNTDYGTIDLVLTTEENADFELPNKDDVTMIDPDSDLDIEDYLSEDDLYIFIEDLFIKIGFSEEYSAALADIFYDEIAYEIFDDDYYDNYYDDFYYDDTFGGYDSDDDFFYPDSYDDDFSYFSF